MAKKFPAVFTGFQASLRQEKTFIFENISKDNKLMIMMDGLKPKT